MVTVRLVGGLGNQLFGYFLGRYLQQTRGISVRYDVSEQSNQLGAHDVSIRDLNLPGEFGTYNERFLARIPLLLLRRIFRKMLRLWRAKVSGNNYYTSEVLGFDENLEKITLNRKFLSGYFQSAVYVQVLAAENSQVLRVLPKVSTQWFEDTRREILEVKPIVIHVRRGDYIKHADTYGLLSDEYFIKALELIREQNPESQNAEIWVFTDSPESVNAALPILISNTTRLVEAPIGTSDSEILIAMSFADKLVISNSTFSWWAAMLNLPNKFVIAPNKWYKNMEDPAKLIPKEWITQPSLWV